MEVVIIKYDAGNVFSVEMALRRLGVEPIVTDDFQAIRRADRVLLPGQGEATTTMESLRRKGLDTLIRSLCQPVLGICIGQQLMCRSSEEGNVNCLGIFDVDVKRFIPHKQEKIPQVGWNTLLHIAADDPLMRSIGGKPYAYFIHSYYVPVCPWTIATTEYAAPFSASLHHRNFYATQFHPEKSGTVGQQILKNFLEL